MHMLYNSDSYVVVRFDVPSIVGETLDADVAPEGADRGGYEIVDKAARKEIFIQGALAQVFQEGVQALIEQAPEQEPSEDEMDAFIARYTALMQQPLVMH